MMRDSIGDYLKTERETRRLSIEEVSSTTRIPRRTLESLEDDRFEDLPSGVFVRGFIKAYASAVDIDADEVLARFDEERPQDPVSGAAGDGAQPSRIRGPLAGHHDRGAFCDHRGHLFPRAASACTGRSD